MEGFLFPDTYVFFRRQNPESVIRTLLANFGTRMDMNGVFELVEESEFTLYEIVKIASLIERETGHASEFPIISSVIHNRLNPAIWPTGLLQIDATIQYILPELQEVMDIESLEIDSPFNSYMYPGLPPTPIANPGIATILAALNPASTSNLFYALHVDGFHRFFQNYAQHSAFVNSPDFAHFAALTGGG